MRTRTTKRCGSTGLLFPGIDAAWPRAPKHWVAAPAPCIARHGPRLSLCCAWAERAMASRQAWAHTAWSIDTTARRAPCGVRRCARVRALLSFGERLCAKTWPTSTRALAFSLLRSFLDGPVRRAMFPTRPSQSALDDGAAEGYRTRSESALCNARITESRMARYSTHRRAQSRRPWPPGVWPHRERHRPSFALARCTLRLAPAIQPHARLELLVPQGDAVGQGRKEGEARSHHVD